MPDRAALEDWLVARVAEILEVPQDAINAGAPFTSYGLESLDAYMIAGDLATWLNRELSATLLWEHSDIESLASFLAEGVQAEWKSLTAIQAQGTQLPFFCVHDLAGSLFCYHDLARYLGEDQPVYGFQAPPPDTVSGDQSIAEMASRYIEELREFQPKGPYLLGGVSFSGIVAFEMARQLRKKECEVGLVALFDSHCPKYAKSRQLNQRISRYVRYLSSLPPKEKYPYLRERFSSRMTSVRAKSARYREGLANQGAPDLEQAIPAAFRSVKQAHRDAVKAYTPPAYPGTITLFRAEDKYGTGNDPYLGWHRVAQDRVEVHDVPGDHVTLIKEPHVRALAQHLSRCLNHAQGHEA